MILDIGGVHSSVGEYVNLWDYIDSETTSEHKLSFFYLERGASGSTCWMNFSIPSAKFYAVPVEDKSGSLELKKTVIDNTDDGDGQNQKFVFDVEFVIHDGMNILDDYPYEM